MSYNIFSCLCTRC